MNELPIEEVINALATEVKKLQENLNANVKSFKILENRNFGKSRKDETKEESLKAEGQMLTLRRATTNLYAKYRLFLSELERAKLAKRKGLKVFENNGAYIFALNIKNAERKFKNTTVNSAVSICIIP